ncbi:hypothetical protein PSTT_15752 [Puccinia striiformis]|uniref:Uncharacterized protein n=1 Tax=Puccinia striiformis TaxID=27350 RepID=A0A2S4UG13_9BASI|nr:hypothetical protein PSTT_15752 [Puccinia striiformis]
MIVLTPPDDEDDYCTVSPLSWNSSVPSLQTVWYTSKTFEFPPPPHQEHRSEFDTQKISTSSRALVEASSYSRPACQRTKHCLLITSGPQAIVVAMERWLSNSTGTVLGWEGTVSYFNKQYNLQNKLKKIATKNGQAHTPQTKNHPAVAMFLLLDFLAKKKYNSVSYSLRSSRVYD